MRQSRIPKLPQESLELGGCRIALLLDVFRGHGVLVVQILECGQACALVGAEVRLVGLHEQAVQPVDDDLAGFVAVDLLAGGLRPVRPASSRWRAGRT